MAIISHPDNMLTYGLGTCSMAILVINLPSRISCIASAGNHMEIPGVVKNRSPVDAIRHTKIFLGSNPPALNFIPILRS
jgi:hypothetical protein